MSNEYRIDHEPEFESERRYAWETAIGLQAVDGLKTSKYLKDVSEAHIEGKISIDKAKELLEKYHPDRTGTDTTAEADIVSSRITEIIGERGFTLSPITLVNIHNRLFKGIYDHAGKIRNYSISKKEDVLNGDTVLYTPGPDVLMTLEYDFDRERRFDYRKLSEKQAIAHMVDFISGIWQIHPFGEGNTRTIATFTIKYLRSKGYMVDNRPFKDNSLYFRNALVRANYENRPKGIQRNPDFLHDFFDAILSGRGQVFDNRNLQVGTDKGKHAPSPDRKGRYGYD